MNIYHRCKKILSAPREDIDRKTEKIRYFAGNLILLSIGTFVPKALSFLMLPFYTSYLSASNYGTADLLNNTCSLLMPFLTLQVQDAVMRFSLLGKEKKENVLITGFGIAVIGGVILFCVCALLRGSLSLPPGFLLFLCILYFVNALQNIFTYFCRSIDQVKTIAVSCTIQSAITVGCSLLLLIPFRLGLYGYVLGHILGVSSAVLYLFFQAGLGRYILKGRFQQELVTKMVKFSVPMIFSAVSWWVNSASDKYILTFFHGVAVVGVYAVSGKISAILSSFGSVVSASFSISAIKDFDPEDTDGFLGVVYSSISFCSIILCSILILCNLPLAGILFSNEFFEGWKFAPPLLVAVAFAQISLSCQNILLAVGRTDSIFSTTFFGAALNTILNLLLIPHFGAYGAGLATMAGFVAAWLLRYIEIGRYIRLKHHFRKELLSYGIVLLQMTAAYRGNKYIVVQFLLFVCLCALFRDDMNLLYRKVRNAYDSGTDILN